MTIDQTLQNAITNPPAELGATFDDFTKTFSELAEGWKAFGETGYLGPMEQHMRLAWDVSQTGKVDFTALTKASISMLGLIPGIGPVVPFLNMFVGFVFPKMFGAKGVSDNQAYFNLIMLEVEKLVDQKFRDDTVRLLNNSLDGIQGVLADFQSKVQVAIDRGLVPDRGGFFDQVSEPSVEGLLIVRESFISANQIIISLLPNFKNPYMSRDPEFDGGTVLLTLPMYTVAATLHLVLKQSYIQFSTRWLSVYKDNDTRNLQKRYLDTERTLLQAAIKGYTHEVSLAYLKYLPVLDHANKKSVNAYNRYVRGMHLQCFDIVSTWPALDDAFYYNASADFDKTRLVFSDIAGPWEGNDNIKANIVDVFTPVSGGIKFKESSDLRAFSYTNMELSSVEFGGYQHKSSGTYAVDHDYCSGLTLKYDEKTIEAGFFGSRRPVVAPMTYLNIYSQNTMYLDYSLLRVDGNHVVGGSPLAVAGQSSNIALPNQKINAIYPVQSNDSPEKHADTGGKWGFMSSHVPFDLFPENYIGDADGANPGVSTIKGFPLQKGRLATAGTMVCVSEPVNSASAVDLAPGQKVVLDMLNKKTQNYRLRIRYACSDPAGCVFEISFPGLTARNRTTLPSTKDLDGGRMFVAGTQGKYVVQDILRFDDLVPSGCTVTFSVSNTSNQHIFLDRLEVISGPAIKQVG